MGSRTGRKIRNAARERANREKLTLKYTRWTLFAAVAAVFVGIVGVLVTVMLARSALPRLTSCRRLVQRPEE